MMEKLKQTNFEVLLLDNFAISSNGSTQGCNSCEDNVSATAV